MKANEIIKKAIEIPWNPNNLIKGGIKIQFRAVKITIITKVSLTLPIALKRLISGEYRLTNRAEKEKK